MELVPIESNPEVINKFLDVLGVSDKWRFTDVCGLSDNLLQTVPRPVISVVLQYPTPVPTDKHHAEENVVEEKLSETVPPRVFFMKQHMRNVCATLAIIHSVANNLGVVEVSDGLLKRFLSISSDLSPSERGEMLKTQGELLNAHVAMANEGQTNPMDAEVGLHFVTFVCLDGQLYELDGMKPSPVAHGPTSPATLLEDAVVVVKEFMARDPYNLNFTLMAMTPANDEVVTDITSKQNVSSDIRSQRHFVLS